VKRVSKKNGEISAAICQNIGQSKLKSFCVCEENEEWGGTGETKGALKTAKSSQSRFFFPLSFRMSTK
jgi:hypothetical protein